MAVEDAEVDVGHLEAQIDVANRLVQVTRPKHAPVKNSLKNTLAYCNTELIGLYHPLDGVTDLKYKLLRFLTPNK